MEAKNAGAAEVDPLQELYDSGVRGNEKTPTQRKKEAEAKATADAQKKVDAKKNKVTFKKAALFQGGKKIVHNKFKLHSDGQHYLVPKKLFDGADKETEE